MYNSDQESLSQLSIPKKGKKMYKILSPYKNQGINFLKTFLDISKNKEIENMMLLEKLINKKIFLEVFENITKINLEQEIYSRNYNDCLSISLINYINFLCIKSKILLDNKKWDIFTLKKMINNHHNCEELINILNQKVILLNEMNHYISNNLVNNDILESISLIKRRKFFELFSLDIFRIIILFAIKIKIFSDDSKTTLVEILMKLIEINDSFSYTLKNKKKDKKKQKYKLSKIDLINNNYIVSLLQNLRYYYLDQNLDLFKENLSKLVKNLLKDFPEEGELLIQEISTLFYYKDIDLSTIYEESQSINEESHRTFDDSFNNENIFLNNKTPESQNMNLTSKFITPKSTNNPHDESFDSLNGISGSYHDNLSCFNKSKKKFKNEFFDDDSFGSRNSFTLTPKNINQPKDRRMSTLKEFSNFKVKTEKEKRKSTFKE